MGSETMFDLESAIQRWKEVLGANESFRTSDVLELESHLRESVTELSQGKLSEHEAFLIAMQRLGQPNELNKEFSKVHGTTAWRKRILWMLCGSFIYSLCAVWFSALTTLSATGLGLTGMGATMVGATSIFICAIAWVALLGFAFHKSKSSNAGPDRIPFTWLCGCGFFLVLGFVLNQTGTVLQTRSLESSELQELFYWQGLGFWVINMCVLVAIFSLIWTLNEQKTDAMETVA